MEATMNRPVIQTWHFDLHDPRDGQRCTPSVTLYPQVADGTLQMVAPLTSYQSRHQRMPKNPTVSNDVSVSQSPEITIRFDYPLMNPAELRFQSPGGFTMLDFLRCVHDGYTQIYAAEKNPGEIPGSYNRSKSEGPYGIWGHHIDDLCLEEIRQTGETTFELGMGS